ncbi:MAG: BrnT family toxin [Defluviitaleaceae bacterium]|nr:BrnT family toxin [Defluviitaleaceae bacterium]
MHVSDDSRTVTYELEGLVFIWDKLKAKSNKDKHDISFEEAATVFILDGAEEFEDEEHSGDEERLIVIGLSKELRVLTVIHCWRENETIIRIISARKATKLEQMLWMR